MAHKGRVYDSKSVYYRTEEGLVPFDVGVVPRSHVIAGWTMFAIVFAGVFAGLIYMFIVFAEEKKYYITDAETEVVGSFIKYFDRTTVPYNGPVSTMYAGVVDHSTCITYCDSSNCLFFTHDTTNQKCYVYNPTIVGVLPDPNELAAIPGPTSTQQDVYVRRGQRVVELRGALTNAA